MRKVIFLALLVMYCCTVFSQKLYNDKAAGNPVLPGYFADPTVKKFGDTYYIYATTDGNGGGFGPPQVWMSKDFVNWSMQDMNWPATHHYWAPDVTQAPDGKYYMYYCQPVEIFGAWANTPTGPWTPLLPDKQPVVKNFLVPNVITLDGQTFRDDDGKMYMFWGTWGIYPDHGCGVGLLNPDMKSFSRLAQIPNTVVKEFFEAPFMFKRNGLYYLTYSSGRCEDGTYRVQYAVSKSGPMGPFEFGKNNPVLSTNADGTVHGPGHQSVLQEGDNFYLIYHRHNNPHSGGGYHRQVAADRIVFDKEGNIEKIVPTHDGIGFLAKNANPSVDLLFGKPVAASSFYDENFKPAYVTDHNNGTLWKPENNTSDSWLSVDMGVVQTVKSVHTQFEFATWYYQYLIEYSVNGSVWKVFADQTKNTVHGSPMIDRGNVKARYLRITVTNTEYPGLNRGLWNIRAFADAQYDPKMLVKAKYPATIPNIKPQGLLVNLDATNLALGAPISRWDNKGTIGGSFKTESATLPVTEIVAGRKAVLLSGKTFLKSDFSAPESLSGNSSFTISMWLNNPVIEDEEPVISWTRRGGVDMTNASFGYGSNTRWGAAAHWGWADMPYQNLPAAGRWHHVAVVFDGTREKLYVDGKLDRNELKMLYLANLTDFIVGTNADHNAFFSGALASLKVYDTAMSQSDIRREAETTANTDIAVSLSAARNQYGVLTTLPNHGYAGGLFQFNNNPDHLKQVKIADWEGKIALELSENSQMKYELPQAESASNYSVVYDMADHADKKGWQHIVQVKQGDIHALYINGKLINSSLQEAALQKILSIKHGSLTLNGDFKGISISNMVIYDHVLNAAAIQELVVNWQKNRGPLIVQASFEKPPLALTPNMVSLSAKRSLVPGRVYQYDFTASTIKGTLYKQSGWQDSPEYLCDSLQADKAYVFSVKVKDNYGNVGLASAPYKVYTNTGQFRIFEDDFTVNSAYKDKAFKTSPGAGVSAVPVSPIWDGLAGMALDAASSGGKLQLSSTGTYWDGTDSYGPYLYKQIAGDFVAEVTVTDVSGLKEKKTNGANDAGLMVRQDSSVKLLQNSIFPGWGIGNMVTSLDSRDRVQTNNQTAWNFYKHLQIQRSGNLFHLRASSDGISWKELPGSPVLRNDMEQKLQVGLFHATYGRQSGYGTFDNFRIIQQKIYK